MGTFMNKAGLVRVVGRVLSTRKEADAAVETMLRAVRLALRSGEKVVLAGIGSFHVKMRKAKVGRNPRTGQTVQIPPRRAVRFKTSKELFDEKL
jgi:DNA-binding protein HU-beta